MYYYEFIHDDKDRADRVKAWGLPRYLCSELLWSALQDMASRVWLEDRGRVQFVKLTCHYLHEMSNVDPAEFTFVKLASLEVRAGERYEF